MTVVSEDGRFEWDSEKDAINLRKHGFLFQRSSKFMMILICLQCMTLSIHQLKKTVTSV